MATQSAVNLKRFRGILNSTTNLIITEMEEGLSYEKAVKKAQDLGIAETDPSADVDGWDAAVRDAKCVIHTASPFPMQQPDDAEDVIRPAREGTLRVCTATCW